MTNEIAYQILAFFGLQAIIFIIAMISMFAVQRDRKKLKIIATASYTALKALKDKDPIFYNSVIMTLPDLEKRIISEVLTPTKSREVKEDEE